LHALVSIELVVVLVEKRMHSKLQEVAPVHQLGDGHHLETGHLLSGGGSDKEPRRKTSKHNTVRINIDYNLVEPRRRPALVSK